MKVWEKTDERAKYGVVIYNYDQPGNHRLKLNVGDTVHISKQGRDWYYGYNTRSRHIRGVFPKNYVHLKEVIVIKTELYETITSKELPIVQEITSVLREWGTIWRDLYAKGMGTVTTEFEEVRSMMNELIDWRKLIMSRKLTVDEMKSLQYKVTHKIDLGNARLGLDLVVRDEEGNILDPATTSTISLYRQHLLATERIQQESYLNADHQSTWRNSSFNLFVNVSNFVCRIGEDADILMTLYDGKEGAISENYIMKWGNQGMPKDIEMLHNLKVLFTDLGQKDATRQRVFLLSQIIRRGVMDLKEPPNKKQTQGIRRPFGVAAIDVTEIIQGTVQTDDEKPFFVPFLPCGEKDFLDNVVRKIVSAKDVSHKGQGLWLTIRKLPGELQQVQKDYPHLISNATAIARKMGFPDVIMPGDVRNDLYVTLVQGEFRKGHKSSEKNVEVTMCVCNQQGEVLQGVISEGSGGNMCTHYKSVIYYHEDKPKWLETIKISVPVGEFYDSHLKFTFKHRSSIDAKDRSEKPFAMSSIKLMQTNGTTLRDSIHDLLVYKIEGKKQESSRVYLTVPSTYQELSLQGYMNKGVKPQITAGALSLNTQDSFQILTLVCSTKLTHNVDLMGLLKWRDNPGNLKKHLMCLMNVDGEEIVKFLQDVLDALFNILMQNSDSDVYDNLVLDALVYLVDLISNRKYSQFRTVLDVYIKENFSATLVYNKLMVVLKYYIGNTDKQSHESMLRLMKSLEYIFKFIIRSRILFAALNDGRGKQQFGISIKQVFTALNDMMQKGSEPQQILIQGSALKYLPATISDVMTVMDPQEISKILIDFIKSVPPDKLVQQKLKCINDIVHSPLFHLPEARRILLPEMMSQIRRLLEDEEKPDDINTCIKVLSDIMDMLFKHHVVGPTKEDLTTVTISVMRTVMQTVIMMDRDNPVIMNCVAVLTAMLRQMLDFHYTQYINNFATDSDLQDFLVEILMMFQDLVTANVYPNDWNEMIMLQNSVFLKAMGYFSNTIRDRFTQPFAKQVWNNFFYCAIAFLTQAPLQLENFSSAKRNKIISRYKDMRRLTGFEIRSMWHNLRQHKLEFIPDIVGSILEMTLIPETELRKATIPIFFDMMQCEFMSIPRGAKHMKGNFNKVEREIISKFDVLVEGGRGDEQYRELFYHIMIDLCEGHSLLRESGMQLVEMVKELLQRLLEYRAVIDDENKDHRKSCIVNLLNFYHDINRQGMYIRYLHKLSDLHLECDDYTEAAYTLLRYAELLEWSDKKLAQFLISEHYPSAQTHRELKEALYYCINGYFSKGKMWEKGIELCKELAFQYEAETFDYIRLSKILVQQAEFYDCIMNQMRPEPEYFRVGYFGQGFPPFLQNKVFIYRGKEYERLSDFSARIQNQFPNAKMMKTLNPPTEELLNSQQQYLQINGVEPILELASHLSKKSVCDQILKYYKVNQVQKFTYSKIKDESKDITALVLERTNLVTAYPLPGILRWFPVTSTHTFEVSPLENCIETLEKTNQRIKSLTDQHMADTTLRVDPLGMVLNGVVDAAVNGGIAKYKRFFMEEYIQEHPEQKTSILVSKLKKITIIQLELLKKGLDIHRVRVPDNLMPFQAHMDESFEKLRLFIEKEYGLRLTDEPRSPMAHTLPAKRTQTMPPVRHSEIGLTLPRSPGGNSLTGSSRVQSAFVKTFSQTVSPSSPSREVSRSKFYTKVVDIDVNGEAAGAGSSSSSSSNRSSRSSSFSLKADRDSKVIELNEQLTPQRPLRPDSDRKSRPISGQFKLAKNMSPLAAADSTEPSETSTGEADGEADYDEPPPLPEKQAVADYANTPDTDGQIYATAPQARSFTRSGTHKGRPQMPLPVRDSLSDHMNSRGRPSLIQLESPPGELPSLPPKKPQHPSQSRESSA